MREACLLPMDNIFHQRCVALVVEDGMKQMGMAVVRVREVVKWIKSSSARSNAFKDIAKVCKVDTKILCQDVPTRWNLTYLMLELALPYELAIKLFSNVNPQFGRDLRNLKHNDLTVGVPGEEDWIEVRKVCSFLQFFYVMTRLVSGTMYATSHSFLMEMCDIFLIIKLLEDGEDAEVSYMAKKMMEKLGKYWLEEYELNPNMNKILYIAAMLVPRQKMKHVEFCLKKLYGDARANELAEELRKSIFDLFELYKKEFTPV
ncbi:zinc finger BED domain-containing protein RICESLEEPER 2-like [Salvia splendens]|uniref:zinc finger BED domain-containing protein RICESLEEPER 2-like n=1 Tax=Salvia splendens TaxID=180675 RepID=UPI001C27B6B0|nr:zinc finger BED domain-containing protein RICESLEEPER 2-like [Salvia splendens]